MQLSIFVKVALVAAAAVNANVIPLSLPPRHAYRFFVWKKSRDIVEAEERLSRVPSQPLHGICEATFVFERVPYTFYRALLDGATTLELDNGITKDGVPVVWHDEEISAEKCRDTAPALTYAGAKIPTLTEVFDFARCVDFERRLKFNVESKINPVFQSNTKSVDEFVNAQYREFWRSGYPLAQITYQSFDWRTLVAMKALNSKMPTAALADPQTTTPYNGAYPFLAGLNLDNFPGDNLGTKVANAAKHIKADVLSPNAGTLGNMYTTKEMVNAAHRLGMTVVPWTVNDLSVADALLDMGVDGIITDFPSNMRRFVSQKGRSVAPLFNEWWVNECLKRHNK
ncbi:glycerophosphoryl diester phosphodiesterase [Coprinopsis cinerea okayama7|uniref:Glycerophosphoryl diester phosphodiesterase n=1 Tax=Coprinopsis cinerea (strain Okayama-7 / 130 / ATCC MYA-4618 / FGSC 9003) TaxID=240176 RepID=A8N184_COPC7|nr:glycerophosphoryl diester phosphodiesterase [Coprinopsis cinerea okayama7\|eukprot:XP_001828633.2 glycerophosphoryl diester phosphodiesterase [Coprinopsis cinerea okayama7\